MAAELTTAVAGTTTARRPRRAPVVSRPARAKPAPAAVPAPVPVPPVAVERAPALVTVVPELIVCGVIACACVLVFLNTLHNTLALEDYYRVVDNPSVQRLWSPWQHFLQPWSIFTLDRVTQYRPLLPLSLSIDYAIAGNNPVAFHIGNLVLQVLASVLAFLLALELVGRSELKFNRAQKLAAAGFAALLFAIHPVSGIVVNYVFARDLLLMQIFLLGALLAYSRMSRLKKEEGRHYWQLFLGLLAVSMLARPDLVVAPLLVLAFDGLIARKSTTTRATWRRAFLAGALVLAVFLGTQAIVGFADLKQILHNGSSPWYYGLTQARLHLFHYLPHLWWPFPIRLLPATELATLHDYRAWAGVAFFVITVGLALWLRRKAPLVAFCIVAYWILMIPESSVLPQQQAAVDYRPYPASIFLFLTLTVSLFRFVDLRRASVALAGFVLFSGAISVALNRQWRTGERLWSHSASYGSDAAGHMNLAVSIPDRADPRVSHHLEEALRLKPNEVLAHSNLCLAQIELGNIKAGVARCERAVAMEPASAQLHYLLATAYRNSRRPADALRASTRATQLEPANLEYHYQAALDAQLVNDWHTSLEHTLHVRMRTVEYKDLRLVRGYAMQKLRRNEEAVAEYRQYLSTAPHDARVNFYLAFALTNLGRCEEAIPYYWRAIELQPTYAEAHYYLERCNAPALD
jgi:protein O-mannosyl-transferase